MGGHRISHGLVLTGRQRPASQRARRRGGWAGGRCESASGGRSPWLPRSPATGSDGSPCSQSRFSSGAVADSMNIRRVLLCGGRSSEPWAQRPDRYSMCSPVVIARGDSHDRHLLARLLVRIDDVGADRAAEPGPFGFAHEDARTLRSVCLLDPNLLAFLKSVHRAIIAGGGASRERQDSDATPCMSTTHPPFVRCDSGRALHGVAVPAAKRPPGSRRRMPRRGCGPPRRRPAAWTALAREGGLVLRGARAGCHGELGISVVSWSGAPACRRSAATRSGGWPRGCSRFREAAVRWHLSPAAAPVPSVTPKAPYRCGAGQQDAAGVGAARGRPHPKGYRSGPRYGRARHDAVFPCVAMEDGRGRPEAPERAVDTEEELPEELRDGREPLQ